MTDESDGSESPPPAEQSRPTKRSRPAEQSRHAEPSRRADSPPVSEAMTTEWFVDHLEELDAHAARLLESIPETEAFDDETRARTRRRLREIRAQINPLLVALRSRVDTDDPHTASDTDDPPPE